MDLETNAVGKQEILASGSQGKPIVARTWFGRTRREQADEYLKYNYENGVLEVEKTRPTSCACIPGPMPLWPARWKRKSSGRWRKHSGRSRGLRGASTPPTWAAQEPQPSPS
jgi:hypothetical protein